MDSRSFTFGLVCGVAIGAVAVWFIRDIGGDEILLGVEHKTNSTNIPEVVTVTPSVNRRFRQRQLGTIGDEDLEGLGGKSNSNWYNSPMYTDWWRLSDPQSRWAPDFIQFMEEEVMANEGSIGRTIE